MKEKSRKEIWTLAKKPVRFLPTFHQRIPEEGKSLSLRLPWSTQKVPDWPRPYKEPQSPKTKKTNQTKEGKRKEGERKGKGRKKEGRKIHGCQSRKENENN